MGKVASLESQTSRQSSSPALAFKPAPDGSFISPEDCSAVYGTVHYKEPLKSFEMGVGRSPAFGLPSVAILP